MYETNDLN